MRVFYSLAASLMHCIYIVGEKSCIFWPATALNEGTTCQLYKRDSRLSVDKATLKSGVNQITLKWSLFLVAGL